MRLRSMGVLLCVLALASALWGWGSPSSFVEVPSLRFVMTATGGLTLVRFRRGDRRLLVFAALKRSSLTENSPGSDSMKTESGNWPTQLKKKVFLSHWWSGNLEMGTS